MLKPHGMNQRNLDLEMWARDYRIEAGNDTFPIMRIAWFTALPVVVERAWADGRTARLQICQQYAYQLAVDPDRSPLLDRDLDPERRMRSITRTIAGWWYSGEWLVPDSWFGDNPCG
jgi:hypothetical protein